MTRVPATRTLGNAMRRAGFVYVAGVDEVGRGCLAGPVVAAAVILRPDRHVSGVADSKAVPAAERESLFEDILQNAFAWAVSSVESEQQVSKSSPHSSPRAYIPLGQACIPMRMVELSTMHTSLPSGMMSV